jgi:PAS domain S-box-containing protein
MPVSDEVYQALCAEHAALKQHAATLEQILKQIVMSDEHLEPSHASCQCMPATAREEDTHATNANAPHQADEHWLDHVSKHAEASQQHHNGLDSASPDDIGVLVHELRTHQIELELQNEELRRVQRELEESRNSYRDLYEFAPVGYITTNEHDIIIEANLTSATLLGLDRGTLQHHTLQQRILPADQDTYYLHRKHVANTHKPQTCDIRLRRDDGTYLFARLETILAPTSDQHTQRYRTVVIDITDRKQAEEAQQQSQHLLQNIIDHMPAALFIRDLQDRFLLANQRTAADLGLDPEQMVGKSTAELYPPELAEQWAANTHQVIASGKPMKFEETSYQDGSLRFYLAIKFPLYDEQGSIYATCGITTDITERKQIEQALRESEEKFRQLTEHINQVFWMRDEQTGKVLYVSPAYERIWGQSRESLYAHPQSVIEPIHPHDRDTVLNLFCHPVKHEARDVEYRLIRPDGAVRWLRTRTFPICDECHELYRLAAITEDITERKQARTALQASEARLNAFFTAAPAGLVLFDQQLRFVKINETAAQINELSGAEHLGRSVSEALPHLADMMLPLLEHVLSNGQPLANIEMVGTSRYSSEQQHSSQGSIFPIPGADGKPEGLGAIFVDITARKRTEAERDQLIEELQLFKAMVDNAIDGVSVANLEGEIHYANPAWCRLFGIVNDETIRQLTPLHYIAPDEQERMLHEVRPEMERQGSWEGYIWFLRQDDGTRWLSQNSSFLLKGEHGTAKKIVSFTRDVTAAYEAQQESERLTRELARSARLKDEFLANMSHELRTPLNAILGMSEVLQEEIHGVLTERQQTSLHIIRESGHHLLDMINDILDLAKIEARKIELDISFVPVHSLCESSIRLIRQSASKKYLRVFEDFDPSVQLLQADERRLKQLLVNLLSNAVKFTPAGGQIGLLVTGDPERQAAHFTVWDTGIGIAQEDMRRLFQPFVQIDSRLARQYEGTGLGLSLVSRLVEMHGGSVTVESEESQGSSFIVTLPWNPADVQALVPAEQQQDSLVSSDSIHYAPVHADSPLILLADDNSETVDMLSHYLQQHGYRVLIARNGLEAVRSVLEQSPVLVLMDIQMPEMDGLEAIRSIREHTDTRYATLPIIALTALAMPGDRERCLEAGANDYLSKPVNLKHLLRLIEEYHHT